MKSVSVHRSLTTMIFFAAIVGSAPQGTAGGLVGESYLGATFDYVDFDEPQLRGGKGGTFLLNSPLTESVDLSTRYSYLYTRERSSREKLDAHEVFFDAAYVFQSERAKPFLKGGIGWSHVDLGGFSRKEWLYECELGIEIPLGRGYASVTPIVSHIDGFDDDVDEAYILGLLGQADIGERTGLVTRITRDDAANWGFSAGLIFRF